MSCKCPLQFPDFQKFGTTIPLFAGLRPYQQVPLQFSLHVVRTGTEPKHHAFLAEERGSPRPAFMLCLWETIGTKVSVVTVKMSRFPTPMRCGWYNPKTGESQRGERSVSNTGEKTFERPAGWEDALLVFRQAATD